MFRKFIFTHKLSIILRKFQEQNLLEFNLYVYFSSFKQVGILKKANLETRRPS